MFEFEVTFKCGNTPQQEKTLRHPHPSEQWTTDDVQSLLNLMSSLVRPKGARFVYAFSPSPDTPGDYIIVLTVDGDAVLTVPLPLQQSVVQEMVARSVAPVTASPRNAQ